MIQQHSIGLAVFALISMSACGSDSAQSGSRSGVDAGTNGTAASPDGQSGGNTAALPACGWPASLNAVAGAVGQCKAARTFLSCQGSKGDVEGCLSDNATQCPDAAPIVGETFSACTDQCEADDYAVACGGPGPGPWPAPPAGCRDLPSNPGGGSTSCCPCVPAEQVATNNNAATFACDSASCDVHTQICEHVMGGIAPGVDFYSCIPIPASCDSDISCACVTNALRGRGADNCQANGSQITVQIDVP
jgi:hypothetical protein